MRAEDMLPDDKNQVQRNGVMIRKGSVGAFLINARVWTAPTSTPAARSAAEQDLIDSLPALRALGLFEVLAIRDDALQRGVVLHAINVYIATTILPSVVRDIGGIDYYAWNTTLFVTASILGSALSARLLVGLGARGAYTLATLVFAAGALICAFAPSMPVMLAGRLIQGLGGGFLFALSYAMIRLVFHETLWPRAMALVSGMWGVATLIGPAVGGVFAELGVWRAAFWSLIPVAGLFALLAAV
eukprot:gene18133-17985_t